MGLELLNYLVEGLTLVEVIKLVSYCPLSGERLPSSSRQFCVDYRVITEEVRPIWLWENSRRH